MGVERHIAVFKSGGTEYMDAYRIFDQRLHK
jgi:hypothetical protein